MIGFTIYHKKFVIDYSGTMKAVKLKLGTNIDSGLMYCVYQNQDQRSITLRVTSFNRFYNFAINKKTSRIKGYKVDTWYTHGQWADLLCMPQKKKKNHY